MTRGNWGIAAQEVVSVRSVSKAFPLRGGPASWFCKSKPILALHDITLHVFRGEVVGLMGPNGSGKSTLLKLIAAALLPDAGRVAVLGSDTGTQPMDVRRTVGLAIAQERSFFPRLDAYENLAFFASLDNVPRDRRHNEVERVLEQCGLADLRHRLVHQFSSGMYQRLAVARALLKRPAVLLLDEPSRSADLQATRSLWRLVQTLAGEGTTVLLATHSLEEAANLAARVIFLRQGRIVSQTIRPEVSILRAAYAQFSQDEALVEELNCEACLP
ncbi:MAG TPA: ABC transporter ATP-binding protein [Terriglobales bacterium]|nr:ABC transporter ATP-binding protein [Terriglobales bacterium]